MIGFSQAKHLLGIDVVRPERPYEMLAEVFCQAPGTNLTTLTIGASGVGLLVFFGRYLPAYCSGRGCPAPRRLHSARADR